ncbi:nucleotidyl transferase AbiEii/AbiGii toxin family protein [Adlercreutzia aquisgranensis]|uniref:Nucleotidyl transferase AbiEii/AbiGii toxin family protein n=1 Tax=Muribaculaceae bacterium Z82 TaxID=2304548 RepID=A0A7C9NSL9_9BACT|nr:nucleotidyl transferase AbiEii/AbiGii toxin family protein [Adlercreutzia aquisgranensis]
MREFATMPQQDRADALVIAAREKGMHPAIVEKDFWVCWTLDYLFSESAFRDSFAFKGGTSLSKGFDLIERFSEDIDLIFDWRLLGYEAEEPWEKRSNTKQDAFVSQINDSAGTFLRESLLPEMRAYLAEQKISGASLRIDEDDPQTLRFFYPQSFSDDSILQEIRLETGALAAWTPTTVARITPYIAEAFPEAFPQSDTSVLTVAPERTFWEKATILHKEAFRTNGRFPSRYSRHYYDLYKLTHSNVKDKALGDTGLLKSVVDFKMTFWRSNAARYDLCVPGSMKLMPPKESMPLVEQDYVSMQNMIFGAVPDFGELMSSISQLQSEINNSRR